MKKHDLIAEVRTPDGARLALFEHDGHYTIRIDGVELMSTRHHASEEALAERLCRPLAGSAKACVLIGGLGFGYTLRRALSLLPPGGQVWVAELMEAVIRWNADPSLPLAKTELADPRVKMVHADVADVLSANVAAFDAIMLDVDNGPEALSSSANRQLYQSQGLAACRRALRAHGTLGIWSAGPDPRFENLMKKAGFAVTVERVRAHPNGDGWHTLFIGRTSKRSSQ